MKKSRFSDSQIVDALERAGVGFKVPDRVVAAYRLDANEYNGRTTVQLMVEFA
jgi:hypothetical protein